jgi:flagellar export protein FliJ
LPRLLRLRELEEEQSRVDLEAAVGQRNKVQQEKLVTRARLQMGRQSFAAGVAEGNAASRTGAVLQVEQARGQEQPLKLRMAAAEAELAQQFAEFLTRRTDRRQVEALVEQQRSRAALETGRRAQQMLDDWYGRRGQKGTDKARRAAMRSGTNESGNA